MNLNFDFQFIIRFQNFSEDSIQLSEGINRWVFTTFGWESAVRDILTADDLTPVKTAIQKPRDFFYPCMFLRFNWKKQIERIIFIPLVDRDIPFNLPLCSTSATWCTKSLEEKEKCDVLRTAGISAGVYPVIDCQDPVSSAISCLKEVSEGRADFTGIDSNLGFIARR